MNTRPNNLIEEVLKMPALISHLGLFDILALSQTASAFANSQEKFLEQIAPKYLEYYDFNIYNYNNCSWAYIFKRKYAYEKEMSPAELVQQAKAHLLENFGKITISQTYNDPAQVHNRQVGVRRIHTYIIDGDFERLRQSRWLKVFCGWLVEGLEDPTLSINSWRIIEASKNQEIKNLIYQHSANFLTSNDFLPLEKQNLLSSSSFANFIKFNRIYKQAYLLNLALRLSQHPSDLIRDLDKSELSLMVSWVLPTRKSALHLCVLNRDIKNLKMLLEEAKPRLNVKKEALIKLSVKDDDERTELQLAIEKSYVDIVKLLLEHDKNNGKYYLTYIQSGEALQDAAKHNHPEVLEAINSYRDITLSNNFKL